MATGRLSNRISRIENKNGNNIDHGKMKNKEIESVELLRCRHKCPCVCVNQGLQKVNSITLETEVSPGALGCIDNWLMWRGNKILTKCCQANFILRLRLPWFQQVLTQDNMSFV